MTGTLAIDGDARRLIRCVHGALDLFGGAPGEMLAWSQALKSEHVGATSGGLATDRHASRGISPRY